jgi:hypothetical protein
MESPRRGASARGENEMATKTATALKTNGKAVSGRPLAPRE